MSVPTFRTMPLSRRQDAFDHPDWIFELKYDGFRALAYIESSGVSLVSRKGIVYKSFETLCSEIRSALPRRVNEAILDGEIVCLDNRGRPLFDELLYRRGVARFCAFDVLWINGRDLRSLRLKDRKRRLARIVPQKHTHLFSPTWLSGHGKSLFSVVCEHDLEGIVAKHREGGYVISPKETTWIKIKNPSYSQADGRDEKFDRQQVSRRWRSSKT